MSLLNLNNIYRYLTGRGNEVSEPKDNDLIAVGRGIQGNFITKGLRFRDLKNAILKSIPKVEVPEAAFTEANFQLQCGLSPSIRVTYNDDIGFVLPTFTRGGIGNYTLEWSNDLLGLFQVIISNPDGIGNEMVVTNRLSTSIAFKTVDSSGSPVDQGDFDVVIKFFPE